MSRSALTSSKAPKKTAAKPLSTHWRLRFEIDAWEEWKALDGAPKQELRTLLIKRLEQPRTPGGELHGELAGCYKIKLRKHGYRLVYEVLDDIVVILVLSVDKRGNDAAYESALERLMSEPRKLLIDGLRKKLAPKTTSTKK